MIKLNEKRFADYFRNQPESGMGYWIASVYLKDGRVFRQVIIDSGYITSVSGHRDVPFSESDIDHFIVTHDRGADARS